MRLVDSPAQQFSETAYHRHLGTGAIGLEGGPAGVDVRLRSGCSDVGQDPESKPPSSSA